MLTTILYVAGLILFLLATFGVPSSPRFNLVAAGLACWIATHIFGSLIH